MLGEWSDPERVADYLARELPHRGVAEELLLEILPARIDDVLDLGTGDGRLLALVLERHPRARAIGVDSSQPMLASARERFGATSSVELVAHDLNTELTVEGPFDAIVSGLAIHHLIDDRKRALFREIYALLAPGGVFANLDLVAPPTAQQHEAFRRAIGRLEDDPQDRPAGLCDQMGWLRDDAGFEVVDCQFKWLELALMVSMREA